VLSDLVEGGKSPVGPSPPPNLASQLYQSFPINRDTLSHSPDMHKSLPPAVSALFQNSLERSGNGRWRYAFVLLAYI
jgi:hypothetical protein